MLMLYDVLLPAGSVPTLSVLLLLVILVYVFQCLADIIRARLLSRVSATIDHDLHSEILELVQQISVERPGRGDSLEPIRDLEQLRNFLSGGGPLAIADLPGMLFFIAELTRLHWHLGLTVLVGGRALLARPLAAAGTEERRVGKGVA